MLFYLQKSSVTPTGSPIDVNVVVGALDPLDNTTMRLPADLCNDATVLQSFSSEGTIKVAALVENKLYPVLTDVINGENCINISSPYKIIENHMLTHNVEMLEPKQSLYLTNLMVKNFGLSQEIASCIIYFSIEFVNFEKIDGTVGPVNVGPGAIDNRFLARTQAVINEINSAVAWPFSSISPEENKTLTQETPTDKLFIELPSRNMLMEENVKTSSFLPSHGSICNPYGMYSLSDMSLYKTDPHFPERLYPMVEGNSDNNTFEVYENESIYSKSLIEWVQHNMQNASINDVDVSLSNPNVDKLSQDYLEELAKYLYAEHWYHNINIPIYDELDDDLDDMVASDNDSVMSDYVFRMNDVEKDAVRSGVRDFNTSGSSRTNALEELLRFLREASLTVGYGAYIQAIIQLTRWGERKPTCILIEGYPLIFSLGDNKVKPYLGKISNYKLKEVDGCTSVATAALYSNAQFKDKKYLSDHNYFGNVIQAPIGLTVTKTLENTTAQGPKIMNSYVVYSIIDIVNSYINNGDIKIAGINYDGNTFSTSVDIQLDDRNTYFLAKQTIKEEDNLETPFKLAQDLQDLLLDLEIHSAKILTHFDILDSFASREDIAQFVEVNAFSSKEDLDNKIISRKIRNKLSAFIYTYGNKLAPIYIKVSLKLNELESQRGITFADVLNIYKEVLSQNSLNILEANANSTAQPVKEMNVFSTENESANTNANTTGVENNTQSATPSVAKPSSESTNVQTNTEVTSSINKEEPIVSSPNTAKRFSFIKDVPDNAFYAKLLDKSGNCVGGYAVENCQIRTSKGTGVIQKFILVDKDTMATVDNSRIKTTMPLTQIIYRLMFNLYFYEQNDESRIVLYFDGDKSMAYYVRLFNELSKEGKL